MSMTIYHFCAAKHVKQIIRQGFTVGAIPEPTHTGFIIHSGWTWLTHDPDPKNQSWATRNAIKHSRTAWRLTIEIPDDELHNLYGRVGICAIYPACDMLFRGFPGSENWRVFHGTIPKKWIIEAKEMER